MTSTIIVDGVQAIVSDAESKIIMNILNNWGCNMDRPQVNMVLKEACKDCYYQCEAGCISCRPEDYVDCCEDAPVKLSMKEMAKKRQEQEKKMNYARDNYAVANCTCPPFQQEKQEKIYMVERLNMLKDEKNLELRQKFGLEDDAPPRTAEDFLKRIADGQYKLREGTAWLTTFYDRVQWRDPAKELDQEGYNAASEELEDAFANTMDEVVVLPEVDGLAALNEFKALN